LLNEISDQTQSEQGRDSSSGPIILVNGKRISGINEVGDFPAESILRVDILTEEVALKYGYGAQQKVVNIILRRRFQAKVANLDGAASTEGGGENGTGDLSDTRIRDNDRINIVGRVKSQAALRESDRGVSSTAGIAIGFWRNNSFGWSLPKCGCLTRNSTRSTSAHSDLKSLSTKS